MAYSVVQSWTVNTGFNVATNPLHSGHPPADTTLGNTIVLLVWGSSLGALCTFAGSDTPGNVYTVRESDPSASGVGVAILTAENAAVITHAAGIATVTLGGTIVSDAFWGFIAVELAPSPGPGGFDVGAVGAQGVLATPAAGPTAAVAGGNEVVLGISCWSSTNSPPTAANGFTIQVTDNLNNGSSFVYGTAAFKLLTPGSGAQTYNGATQGGTVATSIAATIVEKSAPVSVLGAIPSVPTIPSLPSVR